MLELAVDAPAPAATTGAASAFFLDQARAYDAASGRGLRGFVEWVQQLADERARAVESSCPSPTTTRSASSPCTAPRGWSSRS